MDKFVNEILNDNKVIFKGGIFSIGGIPHHLITLTNISTFFQILLQKYGEDAREIIKSVAEKQVIALNYELFEGKFNLIKANTLLNFFKLFGYGKIKIVIITDKNITFELQTSPLCQMNLKLFGKNNLGSPFIEGLCIGISELLFSQPASSIEKQCISMNKENCFIVCEKTQEKKINPIIEKFTPDILKSVTLETKNTQTILMQKIQSHQRIEWENGIFSVWNVPGLIIPVATFVIMLKALKEKFGDYVYYLLYNHTRIQSKNAVILQEKVHGFKKDKKLMQSIVEHSELTGFGNLKTTKVDFKKKSINAIVEFNPFPYYYKKIFGLTNTPIDYYFSGLLAGMAEGFFEVPMISKEIKCVVSGNLNCRYEIRKMPEVDYKIEQKYLDIIEKNITPRNFIL